MARETFRLNQDSFGSVDFVVMAKNNPSINNTKMTNDLLSLMTKATKRIAS
ncbi:hypothetical protein OAR05_03575 [Candidatus Thioglobus sp.]|nr:hypothetical protein [Candidatus Thioglobus sp.]